MSAALHVSVLSQRGSLIRFHEKIVGSEPYWTPVMVFVRDVIA